MTYAPPKHKLRCGTRCSVCTAGLLRDHPPTALLQAQRAQEFRAEKNYQQAHPIRATAQTPHYFAGQCPTRACPTFFFTKGGRACCVPHHHHHADPHKKARNTLTVQYTHAARRDSRTNNHRAGDDTKQTRQEERKKELFSLFQKKGRKKKKESIIFAFSKKKRKKVLFSLFHQRVCACVRKPMGVLLMYWLWECHRVTISRVLRHARSRHRCRHNNSSTLYGPR